MLAVFRTRRPEPRCLHSLLRCDNFLRVSRVRQGCQPARFCSPLPVSDPSGRSVPRTRVLGARSRRVTLASRTLRRTWLLPLEAALKSQSTRSCPKAEPGAWAPCLLWQCLGFVRRPEPEALRHLNRKRLDCFSVVSGPNRFGSLARLPNSTQKTSSCQLRVLISFVARIAVLDSIEVIRFQAPLQVPGPCFCGIRVENREHRWA